MQGVKEFCKTAPEIECEAVLSLAENALTVTEDAFHSLKTEMSPGTYVRAFNTLEIARGFMTGFKLTVKFKAEDKTYNEKAADALIQILRDEKAADVNERASR